MSVNPQRSAIAAAIAVVIAALGAPSTLAVTLSGPSTTSQSLSGSDSLSITPGGTLSVSGDPAVDLSGATTGAGVTVTNQGIITSDDRAIDSDGPASAIHRVTTGLMSRSAVAHRGCAGTAWPAETPVARLPAAPSSIHRSG